MSSADLAHILTLWSNSFRLVCFTVFLPKKKQQVKHLLFYLFPSFKERVLLPFEVTVWVAFQLVVVVIAALCSFWECKGSNFFLLSKFKAKKNLDFIRLVFQVWALPVEAGCKGTVPFLGFARDSRNKFRSLLAWLGTDKLPQAGVPWPFNFC